MALLFSGGRYFYAVAAPVNRSSVSEKAPYSLLLSVKVLCMNLLFSLAMIGLIREKQLGSYTLNSLVERLDMKATEVGDTEKK